MRVGPHTAQTVGTAFATAGTALAGSSIPGGAAIGGVMTSMGIHAGGHVVAAAVPVIVAAAPVVTVVAVGGAVGVGIGWLISKLND